MFGPLRVAAHRSNVCSTRVSRTLLAKGNPPPSVAETDRRLATELDRTNAVYPVTVKSNFSAIARGGLTTDYTFLTRYVDYTVCEYQKGGGDDQRRTRNGTISWSRTSSL